MADAGNLKQQGSHKKGIFAVAVLEFSALIDQRSGQAPQALNLQLTCCSAAVVRTPLKAKTLSVYTAEARQEYYALEPLEYLLDGQNDRIKPTLLYGI